MNTTGRREFKLMETNLHIDTADDTEWIKNPKLRRKQLLANEMPP